MDAGLHVLVVEDTPIAQVILKANLTKQGCTVDQAFDGQSAIKNANTTQYDLILIDIGLGEGPNGFDVTETIKNESTLNADTPVIAVTAHSEPEYEARALSCGMDAYYKKPLTIGDTQEILEQVRNMKNTGGRGVRP